MHYDRHEVCPALVCSQLQTSTNVLGVNLKLTCEAWITLRSGILP